MRRPSYGHPVRCLGFDCPRLSAKGRRPAGFEAGDYQFVLGAANADKSASINCNPQVISRFADVTASGVRR